MLLFDAQNGAAAFAWLPLPGGGLGDGRLLYSHTSAAGFDLRACGRTTFNQKRNLLKKAVCFQWGQVLCEAVKI